METLFENVKISSKAFLNNDIKDIQYLEGKEGVRVETFCCQKPISFECNGGGTLYIPMSVYNIGKNSFSMTQIGWGMRFHSRHMILCFPNHVNIDKCKDMGISRDPVEDYLEWK